MVGKAWGHGESRAPRACSRGPLGFSFSVGRRDTDCPLGPLSTGFIGLSPSKCWSAQDFTTCCNPLPP